MQYIQTTHTTQKKKKKKQWAEKLNRHFSKEEMQAAKRRCSASLITREMQIKTIVRYRLTPVRTVTMKGTQITNVAENVEKRESLYTVGGEVSLCGHW